MNAADIGGDLRPKRTKSKWMRLKADTSSYQWTSAEVVGGFSVCAWQRFQIPRKGCFRGQWVGRGWTRSVRFQNKEICLFSGARLWDLVKICNKLRISFSCAFLKKTNKLRSTLNLFVFLKINKSNLFMIMLFLRDFLKPCVDFFTKNVFCFVSLVRKST